MISLTLYYDKNRQRMIAINNPKLDHEVDVLWFIGYDGVTEFRICENYLQDNCEFVAVA